MKQIQYSTDSRNSKTLYEWSSTKEAVYSNFAFLKQLNYAEVSIFNNGDINKTDLGGTLLIGPKSNLDFNLDLRDDLIALRIVEKNPEFVKIPHSDEDVLVVRKKIIEDAYISLDIATGEISYGSKFFDCEIQDEVALSDEACEFILSVLELKNLYLYKKMTIATPVTKKLWGGYSNDKRFLVYNLLKNLNNLDKLESMFKTFGDKFVFKNIVTLEFEINGEKKKLNQVLDMPVNVGIDLKEIGQENCFAELKKLAAIDKNYASLMTSYAVSLNKLLGQRPRCGFDLFEKFISQCTFVVSEFKIPLKTLLDYLIREKMLYCSTYSSGAIDKIYILSLPIYESTELVDYLTAAKLCMAKKDIEVLPRDIVRTTAILKKNSNIIMQPRAEEFKLAVDAYKHLEWEGTDYIFKTPIDETDLFNEGNKLSHCVASYRDKIIEGCQVIFMRKASAPDEPFVTIEYENNSIVQLKQKFDTEVDSPEILDWVSRWTGVVKRRKGVK